MIENEDQYPYFHHWYQAYCIDILSDELQMEIDFVSRSELDLFKFGTPSTSLINRINRICNQNETKCIDIICQFARYVDDDIDLFINRYKDVFPFIEKVLNNEEFLLKCISSNHSVFRFIRKKFNKHQDGDNLKELDLILKCIDANANVWQYFNDSSTLSSIFTDKQVVMKVIQSFETITGYYAECYFGKLPNDLKNDREVVLKALEKGCPVLKYINSEELKNDREIVLECVRNSGLSLEHAPDQFKNDREIVLHSVNGHSFRFVSDTLKNDREVVLKALEKGCPVLKFIDSEELKNDREIVLKSVRNGGYSLRCAPDHFKNDREIVIEAVRNSGLSLEYAPDQFKNDREIVIEAVKRCCKSLKYASDDLRNDREFIIEMVTKFNVPLCYASKLLQQDRELILSAMKNNSFTINSDAPNELLSNREFILECVKANGLYLRCAPPIYQSDNEVVNEAIKQNPYIIYCIDINAMDCKNTFLDAIELIKLKNEDDVYTYMDLLNRIDDLDVAKKLIETVPFSIHFLNEKFRENYQELTFKTTLLHNGYWMKYSEDHFQERINHAYYSAKIDSNPTYFRNVNKTNLLWKDLKWKKWLCHLFLLASVLSLISNTYF